MRHLLVTIIEAPTHHSLKTDLGQLLFYNAKAIAHTNGSSIQSMHGDPDNPEWMGKLMRDIGTTALAQWRKPNTQRKVVRRQERKKQGLLSGLISSAKKEIVEGLTRDI